jgi:two-component system OmpR family response regulator
MARVLVIDDSSFQRKILSSLLKELGHTILTSVNGREGLYTAVREKPDLIITDLLMPDLDGFTFLREAKTAGVAIPVLILTSDIQTATKNKCFALGAAGVMNKPVKKENLAEMIRQVLGTGKV